MQLVEEDMFATTLLFAWATVAAAATAATAADDGSSDSIADVVITSQTVTLLHSIDGTEPSSRGSLVFDPYYPLRKQLHKLEPPTPVTHDLKQLRGSDSDARYYVGFTVGTGPSKRVLNASVPLSAKFEDSITVHVDLQGIPYHIDYLVNAHQCNDNVDLSKVTKFKTSVSVGRYFDAPRPVLEQVVETPEGAAPPVEQSFLQKYWYYLIPAMMLITSLMSPEEPPKKK
eukprot:jgi/Hompol1/5560/HPOL_004563-RA